MNLLLLASHDPVDHVLPHRFGERLFHWDIHYTAPFNLLTVSPHDTYFTNHLLMTLVAAAIMLLIFPIIGRRYSVMLSGGAEKSVPHGFTNLLESMMQFIRNDVAKPVLGHRTDRFLPFLWTVFFYILICNLLGMIPIDAFVSLGSYLATGKQIEHIGGTATGNIMITAGLAICAFLMIHFSGAKEVYHGLVDGSYGHHHHDEHHKGHDEHEVVHGGGHDFGLAQGPETHVDHHHPKGMSPGLAMLAAPALYIWNFAPHVFKPGPDAGAMAPLMWLMDLGMWAFLLLLEFVGALIKPFALAIRLFANMVAGHVVLGSILALIFVFKGSMAANTGLGIVASLGAAALSCLELFVCFLQAYVFTFLTTLFIGASVAPEH